MKFLRKVAFLLLAITVSVNSFAQGQGAYKIHPYTPNDGGIFVNLTANGKWATIELGSSQGGGTATPKLYNVETDEAFEVKYLNSVFNIASVSNDGNIVVGSYLNSPATYNRATRKYKSYPIRKNWVNGTLTSVTPDGKWAVGFYNGYKGKVEDSELSYDFYYSPLLVNVETGDTIATPGLPTRDMAHLDQHAMRFTGITPDGRYIVGVMSWYIMQPNSGFTFVYDTQKHTYKVIGFTEHSDRDWTPDIPDLYNLCGGSLSPDGHWLVGMAYMTKPQDVGQFYNESGIPYRYDLTTGEMKYFTDVDANIDDCVVDNAGTIIANPNTGSPLRDLRILFQDKYWITLTQICKQYYGFNFSEKTGFDRTGTALAVSGDGSRFVSFVDPMGESYIFDFGQPLENVCEKIDLLDNYTISPAEGSIFSQLSTIEINFGRSVQVLGTGKNVHLYKADGTKVADGLTAGNQGLQLKTGSSTTVNAVFRTRALDAGEKYYVTIDAGSIAVANDAARTNKEIRVNYVGRKNGPVEMVKAAPEDHSQLRQLDGASYVLLTFDCPVHLTDKASAYVERVDDGSRLVSLTMGEGSVESTKNQILLTPSSSVNLYEGVEYRVVVEAGSVCDHSRAESSYNQRIVLTYHGTYVRTTGGDGEIFGDDFNDAALSYTQWLRYEGDHNVPTEYMMINGFDADNMPWQFGMADDETYANMYAGSHSMYSPAGRSDDWMMTPQLELPLEGNPVLEFDAQSFMSSKSDTLKLYVFEEDFEISYLNSAWMEDVYERAVLLDEIKLLAGASQDATEGEWKRYKYDLSKWAGKNVYVAFVNQNYDQSAIFIDNVTVKRDVRYTLGFSNPDRVVNQQDITIAGQFTIRATDVLGNVSLVLKDLSGKEISRVEWPSVNADAKDKPMAFRFDKPLPLQVGKQNAYSIDITMGGRTEVYHGSIANLTFEPTKRVVLEEITGVNCPNCPLGILAIEKCEKAFGDRFIPISIHTYPGDPYGSGLTGYTDFLGISVAAPSGRVNRVGGVLYPIVSKAGKYIDTDSENPLWYDAVGAELGKLAPADVAFKAQLSEDGSTINYTTDLCYALDATSLQLSVFVVVLEDGLTMYQSNNYGSVESDVLGEWGAGGKYSAAAVRYTHNDVARSVVGQNFSGTIGLFPSNLEAGKTYTATFGSSWPSAISDVKNASAVMMLIDSQTGEVINAAKTKILASDDTPVRDVETGVMSLRDVYTLSGVCVMRAASESQLRTLPAGIYVVGGKKMIIRK